MRLTALPAAIDATSSASTIGSSRTPDVVADVPWTYCMYVGRYDSAPSIANPTTKLMIPPTVNTGLRNSRIGSIGSFARSSTTTNAASSTTEPIAIPMITGEPHAYCVPPQLVTRVRPVAARPTSRMPR